VGVDGVVLVHGGVHSSRLLGSRRAASGGAGGRRRPARSGEPPAERAVTLADCVEAVIDSADKARFDRFSLVGHSVCGVTTTETAWQHPQRVAQLISVRSYMRPVRAHPSS
jgi:pimeloyl-ACP methyl ester carboxylesterase